MEQQHGTGLRYQLRFPQKSREPGKGRDLSARLSGSDRREDACLLPLRAGDPQGHGPVPDGAGRRPQVRGLDFDAAKQLSRGHRLQLGVPFHQVQGVQVRGQQGRELPHHGLDPLTDGPRVLLGQNLSGCREGVFIILPEHIAKIPDHGDRARIKPIRSVRKRFELVVELLIPGNILLRCQRVLDLPHVASQVCSCLRHLKRHIIYSFLSFRAPYRQSTRGHAASYAAKNKAA